MRLIRVTNHPLEQISMRFNAVLWRDYGLLTGQKMTTSKLIESGQT
ncbi:hypothetical protein ACPCXF_03355 [Lysinibacillus agricola]